MDDVGKGTPCFGWFAAYPYNLMDFKEELREQYQPQVDEASRQLVQEIRARYLVLGELMLKVKERLASFQAFDLIWELDKAGLIPKEGEPWPRNL